MDYSCYNNAEHLAGIMTEFGRYRLSYEPPEGSVEAEVEMTISSEATLPQMLELCGGFLKASGYVFEGELEIATGEEEYFESKQYWSDKFFKLLHSDDAGEKE